MKRAFGVLLLTFVLISPAKAFFLTAIQEKGGGFGLKGEEVFWLLFRSEPFQGLIYDLAPPKAYIVLPEGGKQPVALRRTKIFDYAQGQKRYAWVAHFLPAGEGDYFLILETRPALVPGLKEVWQEYVKIPLHVGKGEAWERHLSLPAEIVLLTRPYGLEEGSLLRGRLYFQGKPLPQALIQVVPYHGCYLAAEDLPHNNFGEVEASRMYQNLLTDENGLFAVVLSRKGWWLLSARIPAGNYKMGEFTYPLFIRASVWIYVFPSFKPPEKAPLIQADPYK